MPDILPRMCVQLDQNIYLRCNVQDILHLMCVQLQLKICLHCIVHDIHFGLLDPNMFLLSMPCMQHYLCLKTTILEDR